MRALSRCGSYGDVTCTASAANMATQEISLFLFILLCSWSVVLSTEDMSCYKELSEPLPSYIVTAPPYKTINPKTIPDSFDWRNVNNTYFVTQATNQLLPTPCGSCWAHAAVGALTDRIIIAMHAKYPLVPLTPQVLLDCSDPDLGTCKGGSALGAYKFIHKNGITDTTCSPYMGVDDFYWAERPCNETMCRTCDRFGNCKFIQGPTYHISEYGTVQGEDQMKAEVYARGPIACSIYAHSDAFQNYKGGVIVDPVEYNTTTHVVAISGWGEENGMKYWIGRNSFGTSWGELGWFKLQRGVNALDIEKHTCAWAVPLM